MRDHRSSLADKKTKKRLADRSRRARERQVAKMVGISPLTLWVTSEQRVELQSLISSKGWVVVSPCAAANSLRRKTADEDMRPIALSGASVRIAMGGSETRLRSKPKTKTGKRIQSKIAIGDFELRFAADELFASPAEASRDPATEEKGDRLVESAVPISFGTGLFHNVESSDGGEGAEANRDNCEPVI